MKFKDVIKNGCRFITSRYYRFAVLSVLGWYRDMPDDEYLKKRFKLFHGTELDLDHPKTACEKNQWLKLYDRRPEYKNMVDKFEAKKYAASIIGEEHVIPSYGVWDSFDDIDFDKLPDQFILKTTHDSGGFVICKDKNNFNKKKAKRILTNRMKRNFFWNGRQWVYKDIKPRILAEKYIDSLGKPDSVEFKLTCSYGQARIITICRGIAHTDYCKRKNDHFDKDFNYLPFYVYYENTGSKELPPEIDEIVRLSEKLSGNIPQVRVDTYLVDGQIYFGEMTFYTWNGDMVFVPDEWDEKLGSWLILPEKHTAD